MPSMEPTDMPKSTRPIFAGVASSRSLMAGVRVTHEAMLSPGRKNSVYSAQRRWVIVGDKSAPGAGAVGAEIGIQSKTTQVSDSLAKFVGRFIFST